MYRVFPCYSQRTRLEPAYRSVLDTNMEFPLFPCIIQHGDGSKKARDYLRNEREFRFTVSRCTANDDPSDTQSALLRGANECYSSTFRSTVSERESSTCAIIPVVVIILLINRRGNDSSRDETRSAISRFDLSVQLNFFTQPVSWLASF